MHPAGGQFLKYSATGRANMRRSQHGAALDCICAGLKYVISRGGGGGGVVVVWWCNGGGIVVVWWWHVISRGGGIAARGGGG